MKSIVLIGVICSIGSVVCQGSWLGDRFQQGRDRLADILPQRNPESVVFREQSNRNPIEIVDKRKPPTREETELASGVSSFKPNRRPQRPNDQSNVNQGGSDFDLPVQNTGFNRPIPKERDNELEENRGSDAVTEFALNLFKNSNKNEDFVLSPLSPQILLSYLTWVADGQTRYELANSVGYGSPFPLNKLVRSLLSDSSSRELNIATAFFTSKEMRLNNEFLQRTVNDADVIEVDFKQPEAAGRTIHKWATSKTKGGLKLNPINYAPSTKIALTSAIYFKGKFIYTFLPAKQGVFYSPRGPRPAQMMNMKKKFRWGKMGNYAEWVSMPYEGNDALIIILPNRDTHIDLAIKSMNYRDLKEVMNGIDSENSRANVNITLPKFKLESTTNLVEPLQKMGIRNLFTPNAELPYLSDYEDVQVSNAQQQSSIDVNEDGTVLISLTNINVVALSFQIPVPDVEFNVDRPFIAMIADTRKQFPYVLAKVTEPTH